MNAEQLEVRLPGRHERSGPVAAVRSGERLLAIAVLQHTARDLTGPPHASKTRETERARAEAEEWVAEGGRWFQHWCLAAGIEPSRARRALLR